MWNRIHLRINVRFFNYVLVWLFKIRYNIVFVIRSITVFVNITLCTWNLLVVRKLKHSVCSVYLTFGCHFLRGSALISAVMCVIYCNLCLLVFILPSIFPAVIGYNSRACRSLCLVSLIVPITATNSCHWFDTLR